MSAETVVFLHAHPDDEAIFTGGTIAKLAAVGIRVVVVVATTGELGRSAAAAPAGAELARHRRSETRAACTALGVWRVEFLGYADSGLPGDPANHAEGSFFSADPEAAARRVASIVREVGARTLVTYDPGGIYGHPDHLRVHDVGERAARQAPVECVYQATVDREYLHFVETHLVDHARDSIPETRVIGVPSVMVTTMVDVRAELDAKRAAIAAHGSQVPEESFVRAMVSATFAEVYGYEWYVRVGPPGVLDRIAGGMPGGPT